MNDNIVEKNNLKDEFDFKTTFPPLGHPEHHFKRYPKHPWLKSKEDIESWIFNNMIGIKDYKGLMEVHEDLTVSFQHYEINLINNKIKKIPVQIRKANVMRVYGSRINSLIGTPYVLNDLDASSCKSLKSFEGISKSLSFLNLKECDFSEFKGMPIFESNKVYVDMTLNEKINSWDGFTNANALGWFTYIAYSKSEEEKNFNLLKNIPKSIEQIFIDSSVLLDNAKKIFGVDIEMKHGQITGEEIKKIKKEQEIIETAKILNNDLDVNSSVRKRKL